VRTVQSGISGDQDILTTMERRLLCPLKIKELRESGSIGTSARRNQLGSKGKNGSGAGRTKSFQGERQMLGMGSKGTAHRGITKGAWSPIDCLSQGGKVLSSGQEKNLNVHKKVKRGEQGVGVRASSLRQSFWGAMPRCSRKIP